MRFTDLVFDLYGTLVDIHTEENDSVWEKTALYFGFYGVPHTAASLREAFGNAMRAREAKAGQSYECFPDIPFEQVMTELFIAGGVRENACALGVNAAQLFRISSIEYLRIYPGVLSALQAFTAYELRHLGLGAQFDGVLLSSDYGFRKPDVRFYRALTQTHGLDPARCLMIGNDRETDIAGAQGAGMATLFMHTALTPSHQAAADPSLHPAAAPAGSRHYEFSGDDWSDLTPLLLNL